MSRERGFLGGLAPRIDEGRHERMMGKLIWGKNLIERDEDHRC